MQDTVPDIVIDKDEFVYGCSLETKAFNIRLYFELHLELYDVNKKYCGKELVYSSFILTSAKMS